MEDDWAVTKKAHPLFLFELKSRIVLLSMVNNFLPLQFVRLRIA